MRVQLITEGNYPEVVGGVTHWCDLLLEGIPEFDWSVLALGVQHTSGHVAGVPVDFCPWTTAGSSEQANERSEERVTRLARYLFARVGDPTALLAALVDCRLDPGTAAVLHGPRRRHVSTTVLREIGFDSGADDDLLVALLDEAIAAAIHRGPQVDLHLCACVGRAIIPAAVDHALLGTSVVAVEHGIYVREAEMRTAGPEVAPLDRWLIRRSASNLATLGYRISSTVVGVSAANRERSTALGANPERTIVIPNGVAPTPEPAPHRGAVVGMVGRIDPFKGVDLFIEMAALIAAQVPAASFVHIGPTDKGLEGYAASCRELVNRLGLEHRFQFLGFHPHPPALLNEIDVFVQPSRTEGLPFALLEAMAAARPVVASNVGGIPEALGSAGILVPAEAVTEAASAVVSLLTDATLAATLGHAAHEVVAERYRLDHMLRRYREVLEAACQRSATTV